MVDTESVSRAFIRFNGPKLLGVLHKAENDIYERLGEITLEDDADRAGELAEDVDYLIQAINLHLGVAAGRSSSSLRISSNSSEISQTVAHCSYTPYTVSELLSILASLYSVLLDIIIGFSVSETDCANKLRTLVQRILTTFSPTHTIPRFSSSSDCSNLSKSTVSADIRLLDVIAQAERITSLRNTATLLPLFDFALLSVKRLFSNSPYGSKKHQQHQPEKIENETSTSDSVAVMLKAIVVVRLAKRIFSRHALRHLRALHTSNGSSFPHVNLPLLTAISNSPYASELPESAHASVDELRSFLLDYTSCSDELMERFLFYLTSLISSVAPQEEEEEGDDMFEQNRDSSAENDFLLEKGSAVGTDKETSELPEKRRRVTPRSTNNSETTFHQKKLDPLGVQQIPAQRTQIEVIDSSSTRVSTKLDPVDDSDLIEHNTDDDGDDDDNIPLDQLRNRRPKSVDSTLSASWASVSFEPSSDQGLPESSAAASPCSNSTANGSGTGNDAEASSTANRRRSARLSSKSRGSMGPSPS